LATSKRSVRKRFGDDFWSHQATVAHQKNEPDDICIPGYWDAQKRSRFCLIVNVLTTINTNSTSTSNNKKKKKTKKNNKKKNKKNKKKKKKKENKFVFVIL